MSAMLMLTLLQEANKGRRNAQKHCIVQYVFFFLMKRRGITGGVLYMCMYVYIYIYTYVCMFTHRHPVTLLNYLCTFAHLLRPPLEIEIIAFSCAN